MSYTHHDDRSSPLKTQSIHQLSPAADSPSSQSKDPPAPADSPTGCPSGRSGTRSVKRSKERRGRTRVCNIRRVGAVGTAAAASERTELIAGIAEVTEGRRTASERRRSEWGRAVDLVAESVIGGVDTVAEELLATAEQTTVSSRATAGRRRIRRDFVVLAEAALVDTAPAEAAESSRDHTGGCTAEAEGRSSRTIVGEDWVVAPAATDTSIVEVGRERKRRASFQQRELLVAGETDRRKERIVADSDNSIAVEAAAVDTATECRLYAGMSTRRYGS